MKFSLKKILVERTVEWHVIFTVVPLETSIQNENVILFNLGTCWKMSPSENPQCTSVLQETGIENKEF